MRTVKLRAWIFALAAAFCLISTVALVPPALASNWALSQLPTNETVHANLNGISCPSASLCVAAGESDAIASSANPTGGAGRWHIARPFDAAQETDSRCVTEGTACPEPPIGRQVRAISCPSTSLCVAVTYDGYVYSSTDPSGPASSWKVVDIDGTGRDTHLESISCPDPGFCVAVSGNRYTAGKVLTSSDPTGPGSAWQVTQLDESLDLRGVSCLSRSFCVAVASNGRVIQSTNPSGGVSAWKEIGTPGGPGNLEAISCVEAETTLCVSGNAGGNLLRTTKPSAGASSWSEVNGGGSVQITGVSCLSPSRCAAVDNNGDVLTSAEPTSGAAFWSFANLIPYVAPEENMPTLNALFGVSCPSEKLCVLVGSKGRVFTNTDPFAAASSPSPGQGSGKPRRAPKRPRTTLVKADDFHNRTAHRHFKARFRFHANGQVRGFICKRDHGPYRPCRSPLRYFVAVGKHSLRVRAIGLSGLKGPVAVTRFVVIPAHH